MRTSAKRVSTAAPQPRRRKAPIEDGRRSHKVIIGFPAELFAETKRASAQLSMNRSALIRSAVREFLDKWRGAERDKDLEEGYVANSGQAGETAEDFSHLDSERP